MSELSTNSSPSDLMREIERLRREGNGAIWEKENRELREEIERLNELVQRKNNVITQQGNCIDEQNQRIAELEEIEDIKQEVLSELVQIEVGEREFFVHNDIADEIERLREALQTIVDMDEGSVIPIPCSVLVVARRALAELDREGATQEVEDE